VLLSSKLSLLLLPLLLKQSYLHLKCLVDVAEVVVVEEELVAVERAEVLNQRRLKVSFLESVNSTARVVPDGKYNIVILFCIR
jgi:hypothetical protein